jgi:hypothetical protein
MKMNLATLICGLILGTTAFAQTAKKMSPPPPVRPVSAPVSSYSSTPDNEVTANLGFDMGAVNIGATYVKPNGDFGFGGYFMYQSSKDKDNATVVTGVTALGALIKVTLVDNHRVRAYVAPGFGIAMLKDGSIDRNGKKSDETLISPTFKMGVQLKVSPTCSVGLERMDFTNWLNDSVNNFTGPEYYSVAASFEF